MSKNLLWVQHQTDGQTFGPTKVSIQECEDVDDFINRLYERPMLAIPEKTPIALYLSDGTTKIDVGDSPAQYLQENSRNDPLVVRIVKTAVKVSHSRKQEYNHIKAVESSRSYLISIALELEKIYPISCYMDKRKNITFEHILEEAYGINPEPRPEFKNRYATKLNDFYAEEEWNFLKNLLTLVNQFSRLPLSIDDGKCTVILPIPVCHLKPTCQRIAKKTNVVSELDDLIAKSEGSA